MDESTNQRRKEAIEKIIPVIATLSQCEWRRLVSLVGQCYTSKAAKVMLDGSDVKFLEKSLKHEILNEPYCAKTQQQPG